MLKLHNYLIILVKISLKKGMDISDTIFRFALHNCLMKLSLNRFALIVLLIFGSRFLSGTIAQTPDTLNKKIEKILQDISARGRGENPARDADTVKISQLLSKASYFKSVNYDSSLSYTMKAVRLSMKAASLRHISMAEQNLGDYYLSKERFRDALECYIGSLRIEESRKDISRMAWIYVLMGRAYYYMEMFPQALDYDHRALEIFISRNDIAGLAKTYQQLGNLNSSREFCEKRNATEKLTDFLTAIDYLKKSMRQYSLAENEAGTAEAGIDLASVYNKMKKPDTALIYLQRSLNYYRRTNNPGATVNALYVLGKTYRRLGEYDRSLDAFKESEMISRANGLNQGIQFLYEAMGTTMADMGDYKSAYEQYIKYMTIRDSVYNSEKSLQFMELEARYQNEVKQNQILKLTSEKRGRNNLIYLLAGIIVLLASFAYYYIRLLKQNKIIADQKIVIRENKIAELEKERSYLAAKSVLEGEEAERSRLAGDLHNGLGGLLSGIKLNLSSMKENSVITHENMSAFNHALSLLDTSISELRRIAHNLMPETLNHYGLKTALEDFCTQVAPADKPAITVSFFGDEIRYTRELELTVYRIIQELVNNSLKHASATTVNIQVFSEPQRLSVQVIDNGCGFVNNSDIYVAKGKGLENIYNRVTAMNGKLDIWSEPGQGTEISIEFEIK